MLLFKNKTTLSFDEKNNETVNKLLCGIFFKVTQIFFLFD